MLGYVSGVLIPEQDLDGVTIPDPEGEVSQDLGDVSLRDHLRRIAKIKSPRRARASRIALVKAMLVRYPESPRWLAELAKLEGDAKHG